MIDFSIRGFRFLDVLSGVLLRTGVKPEVMTDANVETASLNKGIRLRGESRLKDEKWVCRSGCEG